MEIWQDSSDVISDLGIKMLDVGRCARRASQALSRLSTRSKNDALVSMAASLRSHCADILSTNERECILAAKKDRTAAQIDRLVLNEDRVEDMAISLEQIAMLADPVGAIISAWDRPNGLRIERVRVPIGVIGIIFEARPNVVVDASALCIKSGNACILRPGSDCFASARSIMDALFEGLRKAKVSQDVIQLVPSEDRSVVGMMLQGLDSHIDVIIPRGGKSLNSRVAREARVPVLGHLEGVCHVYIHEKSNLEMSRRIVIDSKMRRTSICGAAETLLIDSTVAVTYLPCILDDLIEAGCQVLGDEITCGLDDRVHPSCDEDWGKEFLDAIIVVRVVAGIDEAIDHINTYGTSHTEAIVTDDQMAAKIFLDRVDSAIVMHNASTQFADGGEFGMGAEIGIATGRLHARGPVGLEQLTSFKYCVRGSGQTRG